MTTTTRSLVTGLLLGAFTINSMSAVIDYEPGVSVKFGPSATVAGINVGSVAGDPSSPVNGDLWYDSTANELTARINGANVALGAGGSTTLTSTYIGYGSGANAVTGEAAFAYDSTFNILSVDAIKLFATGVGISTASSGVLKLEGLGSGFDEAINMDFDTTSNVVQTSSPATGVTIMDYLDMSLRVTDGGGNFATLGPSGITVHNSAWAGNYTLAFGGTDGDAETIASQEWVTANGAAFDATTVDAVTWSDGANASNVWTFNVSGTDPTFTAGNNNFIFGAGSIDLGSAGVRLSQDGDGALTFLGLGNGSDEDLTWNLDDTANEVGISSSTGVTKLNMGTIGVDTSAAKSYLGPLKTSDLKALHQALYVYGAGTAYNVTNSSAAVDMGTTDPVRVIDSPGTYEMRCQVVLEYTAPTVSATPETITVKLRRTNNTAADLTNITTTRKLMPNDGTKTFSQEINLPMAEYITLNSDDSITIFAALSASLTTVKVTECWIYAQRVAP